MKYYEYAFLMPFDVRFKNADILHKAIWKYFKRFYGTVDGAKRDFIYMTLFNADSVTVLCRSINPPPSGLPCILRKEVAVGDVLDFTVTMNPYRTTLKNCTQEKLNYLFSNSQKISGFETIHVDAVLNKPVLVKKSDQPEFYINSVAYSGTLKVINQVDFMHALICGLGRSKAYGMGYLIITPKE